MLSILSIFLVILLLSFTIATIKYNDVCKIGFVVTLMLAPLLTFTESYISLSTVALLFIFYISFAKKALGNQTIFNRKHEFPFWGIVVPFLVVCLFSISKTDFINISINRFLHLCFWFIIFYSVINLFYKKKIIVKSIYIMVLLGSLLGIIGLYNALFLGNGYSNIFKGATSNGMALYLQPLIPLCFGFLILMEDNIFNKALFLVCNLILGAALFLTFSRGGILSSLFGILMLLCYKFNIKKVAIATCIVVFIMLFARYILRNWSLPRYAILKIENLSNPFSEEAQHHTSIGTRIDLIQSGMELIKKSPILGYGIGTFPYQNLAFTSKTNYSHNEYISLLVETGILGLLFFLVFLFIFFKKIVKLLKESSSLECQKLTFILMASSISYLFYQLFINGLGTSFPYFLLGLTYASARCLNKTKTT